MLEQMPKNQLRSRHSLRVDAESTLAVKKLGGGLRFGCVAGFYVVVKRLHCRFGQCAFDLMHGVHEGWIACCRAEPVKPDGVVARKE